MRSPMAEDAQSADKRASMQDWRSFPYFLTDEVWSMLCSSQSQLKKVDGLVNHFGLTQCVGTDTGVDSGCDWPS